MVAMMFQHPIIRKIYLSSFQGFMQAKSLYMHFYKNSVEYPLLDKKQHKIHNIKKVQFIFYKGMKDTKNIKHTIKGIELLSTLSEAGKKIFTLAEARGFARPLGIPEKSVSNVLYLLKEGGWLISLKRGLFALSKGFSTEPLHEFEIAMALIEPVAVSHWSALHHHGLTDQIPRQVFLLTTQQVTLPRQHQGTFGIYSINQIDYVFSRIKKELFFGIQRIWINRTEVFITDLERSLLDGLDKPQLCGGLNEVINAFQLSKPQIDLEKIISYALQWDTAIIKRLGWVLSYIGIEENKLSKLLRVNVKGYRKLDCIGPSKGPCNSKWMIQENIYG